MLGVNAVLSLLLLMMTMGVPVCARSDGLALTPPMGWSSWYAFGADINETKIVQMADAMVSTGLAQAGYSYVNLDDAWMSPVRDRFGRLQGDPDRFPSGIQWLADQIHARGLKLGLYGAAGLTTCMSRMGNLCVMPPLMRAWYGLQSRARWRQ